MDKKFSIHLQNIRPISNRLHLCLGLDIKNIKLYIKLLKQMDSSFSVETLKSIINKLFEEITHIFILLVLYENIKTIMHKVIGKVI